MATLARMEYLVKRLTSLEGHLSKLLGVVLCDKCGEYVSPLDTRCVDNSTLCFSCAYAATDHTNDLHPFDAMMKEINERQ